MDDVGDTERPWLSPTLGDMVTLAKNGLGPGFTAFQPGSRLTLANSRDGVSEEGPPVAHGVPGLLHHRI